MEQQNILLNIETSAIKSNLKRLINQIYKLLPYREEKIDWKLPLSTIIEEISGMSTLLLKYQSFLFSLLCKLQGLKVLEDDKDFLLYRRTIFECLNILNKIIDKIEEEELS